MNDPDSDEEPSEWEDPYKGSGPSPTSSSWLRFFVWLGPSVSIFLIVLLLSSLRTGYSLESIFWLVAFSTTVGFGIWDAHLRMHGSEGVKDNLTGWTIIFTVCQVLLIPLIWFLALYGLCALSAI